MAGFNELREKVKTDAAFAEQFKACKSLDDVIELAEKAGFTVTPEEIEKLTDVSTEDLAKAAGGARFIANSDFVVIASPSSGFVC